MNRFHPAVLVFFFTAKCLCTDLNSLKTEADLNLIGFINKADGIGQIAYNIIQTLKNDIKIKLINSRKPDLNPAGNLLKNIILHNLDLPEISNAHLKNVTIYTDILWNKTWKAIKHIPNESINFAYSMTEYTQVDSLWVKKINNFFDAVLVPDESLINIYQASGVKKPIFCLPLMLNLKSLLNKERNYKKKENFIFGCSAAFCTRKNYKTLIEAFSKEFGKQNNIILKLHGRYGDIDPINNQIKDLKVTNIEVINKRMTDQEYLEFLSSLDCYVFISKGEGFSITPREAIALGIPCILSNNTAHKTICKTNLVLQVEAKILEYAYCEASKKYIGYDFNCNISDVQKALRSMYNNYSLFVNKAKQGRIWVKQYLPENLKPKYLSIIKPKQIIFGKNNIINDNYLMTNSLDLYNKYLKVFNKRKK